MRRDVKPGVRYPKDLVEGVLAMARQGVKQQEIADAFDLHRQAVSRICLRHGIRRMPDMTKIPNLSITRAYEQGCSTEQLAKSTGLARTTVARIIANYGVKIRPSGPQPKHPPEAYYRLIGKGWSYKQIAVYLGVTERTASRYITMLKRRMAELRAASR